MIEFKLDIKTLIAIGTVLITIGLFVGRQVQRLDALEHHDTYYHGTYEPEPKRQAGP